MRIFWKRAGLARPVRTFAKSSFAASTDLVIFSFASARTSAITWAPSMVQWTRVYLYRARSFVGSVADERADAFPADRLGEVARGLHSEDDHRHLVVHAEAERRGVDHLEALHERLLVGDLLDLLRVGID